MRTSRSPSITPPGSGSVSSWTGQSISSRCSARTVKRPTGLHESFCNSVSLGPLSRSSTSLVSGRLAGPGLLGDRSQAARPRTALALPLPRHSDKRREVRPQPIAVCGVPRYVHRHSGRPSLPHSSAGRKIPLDSETVSVTPKPPLPSFGRCCWDTCHRWRSWFPTETQDALDTVAPLVPLVLREGSPPPPSRYPGPGRSRRISLGGW